MKKEIEFIIHFFILEVVKVNTNSTLQQKTLTTIIYLQTNNIYKTTHRKIGTIRITRIYGQIT